MHRAFGLGPLRSRWLALALSILGALAVGAATNVALGSHSSGTHYHIYNGIPHGMVHGSSITDDDWHARIESNANSNVRDCQAWVAGFGADGPEPVGGSVTYGQNGPTCNYWTGGSGCPQNCGEQAGYTLSRAYLGSVETLPLHAHPVES